MMGLPVSNLDPGCQIQRIARIQRKDKAEDEGEDRTVSGFGSRAWFNRSSAKRLSGFVIGTLVGAAVAWAMADVATGEFDISLGTSN
jgi:hypothetical protein